MGRKTQITREMILNASFELLDEGGIGAVAIKSIAVKLGCSTQPISWHFGSMNELKKELMSYTGGRMNRSLSEKMSGKDALEAFFISGVHYISMACDHPRVFRFLNIDDPVETVGVDMRGDSSIFADQFAGKAVEMISDAFNISSDIVGSTVRDIVIYTHGLAAMMMMDGFKLPKDKACRMVFDVGVRMLSQIGIDTTSYKFKDFYPC